MAETNALITLDEAEDVVEVRTSPLKSFRTPAMIVTAGVGAICGVLVIMIFIASQGKSTGITSLFPFLSQEKTNNLEFTN